MELICDLRARTIANNEPLTSGTVGLVGVLVPGTVGDFVWAVGFGVGATGAGVTPANVGVLEVGVWVGVRVVGALVEIATGELVAPPGHAGV